MNIPTTIYDQNNVPMMWRNNHDFKDGSGGAPKLNELFFEVFTETWMILSYIKFNNMHNAKISLINTQEALNFLSIVGNGEGVKRMVINPCNLNTKSHRPIFVIIPLKKYDLNYFIKLISTAEICPVCYKKDSFIAETIWERK